MNTLKQLNELAVCDIVIKMPHDDVYRMLKRFYYTNDGIEKFIEHINSTLTKHNIKYHIINSQTIDLPHCSHRGTKYIELASHYRVDITIP